MFFSYQEISFLLHLGGGSPLTFSDLQELRGKRESKIIIIIQLTFIKCLLCAGRCFRHTTRAKAFNNLLAPTY